MAEDETASSDVDTQDSLGEERHVGSHEDFLVCCHVCDRCFKSFKALENHIKSKKHKDKLQEVNNEVKEDLLEAMRITEQESIAHDPLTMKNSNDILDVPNLNGTRLSSLNLPSNIVKRNSIDRKNSPNFFFPVSVESDLATKEEKIDSESTGELSIPAAAESQPADKTCNELENTLQPDILVRIPTLSDSSSFDDIDSPFDQKHDRHVKETSNNNHKDKHHIKHHETHHRSQQDHHHEEEILHCTVCDRYFKSMKGLQNHLHSKKHKDNLHLLTNEMKEDLTDQININVNDNAGETAPVTPTAQRDKENTGAFSSRLNSIYLPSNVLKRSVIEKVVRCSEDHSTAKSKMVRQHTVKSDTSVTDVDEHY